MSLMGNCGGCGSYSTNDCPRCSGTIFRRRHFDLGMGAARVQVLGRAQAHARVRLRFGDEPANRECDHGPLPPGGHCPPSPARLAPPLGS